MRLVFPLFLISSHFAPLYICNMNEKLKAKLESVPALPGIYQYIDKNGTVIYVGKAKNLRNRVRSYFVKSVDNPKTLVMLKKVEDLQIIATDTEVEALVLENNLIKELKPRYNINLKDDKSYPYIRVTNEPYPQIFPTRDIIRDGSQYFGPYTDVKNMKNSLRMINQLFKIRSCKYFIDDEVIEKKKIKVCLDYHIKKCDGPCEGLISANEYKKMVGHVIKLLRGKTDSLIDEYKAMMKNASETLQFEIAAELRDKIEKLQIYSSKQKVVTNDFGDKDVISAATEDKDAAGTVLNIRGGKLVGKKQFKLRVELDEKIDAVYEALIKLYYDEFVEIPKEILIEIEPENFESVNNWLSNKAGRKVKFLIPKRSSDSMSLVKMCRQNAILQLKEIQLQKMKREGNIPFTLNSLKRDLNLKNLPRTIECFDISHIQGSDTVASMVVFEDGKPKKSRYRKFIIKGVEGVDDFASMREVISRRYSKEKTETDPLPSLIMVDGGKGQLSSAIAILREQRHSNFEIIGLAKRLEEVFLPGISEAQTIPKTSSSLKLLQAVRDEAHRFAITFHRHRRSKRTFHSELTEIEGIGDKISEKLLMAFRNVEDIKTRSVDELSSVIGEAKAKIIFEYFRNKMPED